MSQITVAVLRGGPSGEFEVSLQTGSSVLRNIPENKYKPVDILINKQGEWYKNGLPVRMVGALKSVDVVFNALHGEYGEDGKIQRELDTLSIPYTGSGSLSSAIGMNKVLTKEHFKKSGIKTPAYTVINITDDLDSRLVEIFRTFPHPSVVKPATSGSSLGVSIVRSFNDLVEAVKKAFGYSKQVIVEEFISGKEATCGVVENYRGKDVYALFPVEIIPQDESFFNYDAKYKGRSLELCPSKSFSTEEKREIEDMAAKIHQNLGLRHYSRSDFMIHPTRGVYALEVNTLPGLTTESLLPKALKATGFEFSDFLDHTISLALQRK